MTDTDRNFDDLVQKFNKNIYGTSKGRLRHELLLDGLTRHVLPASPITILDAGGGTGEMTHSLALLGHEIVLNDISREALAIAQQRCGQLAGIRYHCGAINSLPEDAQYDLVLCHAVMEWVADPQQLLLDLMARTRPGGHISLSFYNSDAQLFGNMLYGNFEFVLEGMNKRNQVKLTPSSPMSPKLVLQWFAEQSLTIVHQAGIRCFHDYLSGRRLAEQQYSQLLQLEKRYCAVEPYLWLGKYFHIVAQKQQQ